MKGTILMKNQVKIRRRLYARTPLKGGRYIPARIRREMATD